MKVLDSKSPGTETLLKIHLRSNEVITNKGGMTDPLKPDEHHLLVQCEGILKKGLETFFEVGQALITIRDARLYREDFASFGAYCHGRWGIGRTYAWHLMGAAERVKLLPADTKMPRPVNEFQVRPFLKLEAEAFPKAWEQVISSAKDGKITPALVRGVVAQLVPQKAPKSSAKKKRKTIKLPPTCSIGSLLVMLGEAKKAIQEGDSSKVLHTIERVESELLGMCS